MRLQILSDVHLEFGPLEIPETDADVIIAAGDIGLQTDAVPWLKRFNKPVIYVAGNHEYWGGDIVDTCEALRKACQETNIHYLENRSVNIDGVRFLGCTLWTDMARDREMVKARLAQAMNDFSYISNGNDPLTPEDIIDLNQKSLIWLAKSLEKYSSEKTIVVTHHAPSYRSWAYDKSDILKFAYCNELSDFIEKIDVELWVHGHIHNATDYKMMGTRVVCNPRGYYDYKEVDEFELDKVIEI